MSLRGHREPSASTVFDESFSDGASDTLSSSDDASSTMSTECSDEDEALRFPGFQVTIETTFGGKGGGGPSSFTLRDVVLEAYEAGTLSLSGDNPEAQIFFGFGGVVVDAAGNPQWRVGEELVDKETGVCVKLLSIYQCYISH